MGGGSLAKLASGISAVHRSDWEDGQFALSAGLSCLSSWACRRSNVSTGSTGLDPPCQLSLKLSTPILPFMFLPSSKVHLPAAPGRARWQHRSGLVMRLSVFSGEENFPLAHTTRLHTAEHPSESRVSAAPLMLPRWAEERRMTRRGGGRQWGEGCTSGKDRRAEIWSAQRKLHHYRCERREHINS